MRIPILRYGIDSLEKVFQRSQIDDERLIEIVRKIVKDVRVNQDKALFDYTEKFDRIKLNKDSVKVTKKEIKQAYSKVGNELLSSLRKAKENILAYHKRQLIKAEFEGKTGWIIRPLERAGIYIPGGTAAYPSSVLMCALPAVAAGVKDIIMTTPRPENPLTLVAANECGIENIYKVGGAQAIAAMAYGTESVPKTDIIAGPGNIYVTLAKKEVFGHVMIDMIAGPSEILIIADDTADYQYIIADMLSQAEHDPMSAAILITTSEKIAFKVSESIFGEAEKLKRKDIILKSLESNAAIIRVDTIDQAIEISDRIAPEHLELNISNARERALRIKNAGAIFAGNYSPEPLGDYFAGPSHVLPTSGTARYFSVLSASTFTKRISYIEYGREDLLKVTDDIVRLAECEGLDAHAMSIKVRS